MTDADASPDASAPRCQFLARPGDKRCPLPVRKGASFCGAHDATRPQCPACGTRLRDDSAVRVHLAARCPVTRRRHLARQREWYQPSANLPPPAPSDAPAPAPAPAPGLPAPGLPARPRAPADLLALLRARLPAPRVLRAPPTLPEQRPIADRWSDHRDSSVRMQPKHFAQIASLCALALAAHTPHPRHHTAVIELGAGRAYTAMFAANVLSLRNDPPHVLVVDRASTRWKADRTLRAWHASNTIASFTRCTTDLQHLHMPNLPFLHLCNRVYIIAKHLCGDASDLAIYAATRLALHLNQHSDAAPVAVTLVLACCCRALCTPRTHTFEHCLKHLISPAEFATITPFCAQGLDHTRPKNTHLANQSRLLLDSARIQWMNNNGWNAALCTYTKHSPENTCIVATWKPTKTANANLLSSS